MLLVNLGLIYQHMQMKMGKDQFNAIFFRTNVKSLVWYSPDNFEDNGYEVPTTMEDLIALSDQMVADGIRHGA